MLIIVYCGHEEKWVHEECIFPGDADTPKTAITHQNMVDCNAHLPIGASFTPYGGDMVDYDRPNGVLRECGPSMLEQPPRLLRSGAIMGVATPKE